MEINGNLPIQDPNLCQQNKEEKKKKEAQGLGALLDEMEDNDHIKLDNLEI